MSGYPQLLAALTDAQHFPAIHAVLAAGVFGTADHPDKEFAFGLERILDGIDALIRAARWALRSRSLLRATSSRVRTVALLRRSRVCLPALDFALIS